MLNRIGKLLITATFLLWAGTALTEPGVNVVYPDWFKDSLYDLKGDLQDARASGKKGLMVFFSTKTCSYCQAIIKTAFQEKDIQQRLRKNYDVVGLEVLSDVEVVDPHGKTHWAKDFAVSEKAKFTPTMIFYGESGEIQLRLIGYQSPDKMRAALDYLEGDFYKQMSLRDFMQKNQVQAKATTDSKDKLNLDRRKGSDNHLLVIFESADCAKCQLLRTMLKDEVMQPYLLKLDVVFINSSSQQANITTPGGKVLSGKAWAERLGLIHSPAMVFFNEQGKEVLRVDTDILIDAYGNDIAADDVQVLDNIRARLQFVVEKGYVDLPQFQRWRAQQAKQAH